MREGLGSALRLAELAKVAIERPKEGEAPLAEVVCHGTTPAGTPRRFVVLKPFLKDSSAKKREYVWRVEKQLGVQACGASCASDSGEDTVENPDVLLIEDLNLCFRDEPARWPKALKEIGERTSIILHTTAPLIASVLWKHLFAYRDRLTVLLTADALRARGAAIAAPLSWDQTIEEVAAESEGARFANDLALVKRVVVQFGTEGAASFTRLPLFGRAGDGLSARVVFERCVYDPDNLEGAWASHRLGELLDCGSILAATLARHELDPISFPLFRAVGRGLAAIRKAHEVGANPDGDELLDTATKAIGRVLHETQADPEAKYFSAFPHCVLDDPKLKEKSASKSDLLRDFTGSGLESVVSAGLDVVLRGLDIALRPVPKATYGKFTTVDRDEIERLNTIRNLIVGYLENPKDIRPLSFAVFGPPGSGKSFAVKQLMKNVVGEAATSLEFNLSQIENIGELHQSFHRVRDASIQGRIPFVFWDEFDARQLDWLKDFLAPMQDSFFLSAGMQHAFGKAIFVFAGGTASTLRQFSLKTGDDGYLHFKDKKGPDFISRLRGYIDVKGPNPDERGGHAHVVRRAILVRKLVEIYAPQIIDARTKTLAMDPGVIRAFLTADNYIHGARSLESVIAMSNLTRARFYGPAELPANNLLSLHVSNDFLDKSRQPALGVSEIEYLAAFTHAAYCNAPSAGASLNPYLAEFEKLSLDKQESNRAGVRGTLVALVALCYRLVRLEPGTTPIADIPSEQREQLKRLEHDRWLREVLMGGWAWNATSERGLRLNENILPFEALDQAVTPLDILAAEVLLNELPKLGFALIAPTDANAKATGKTPVAKV